MLRRLDFCDDELELVELCHGLTGVKTRPEVQECFPKTCRTESVAMRPRRRVFHMARRSLQAASLSSIVNDCSSLPGCLTIRRQACCEGLGIGQTPGLNLKRRAHIGNTEMGSLFFLSVGRFANSRS